MPGLTFAPTRSLASVIARVSPATPIRTLIRTTGYKLRPPKPIPFLHEHRHAETALQAVAPRQTRQGITILSEQRPGPTPTVVLGGFVPDATEQVFLLRGFLLSQGSVYFVNLSHEGFALDLVCAQLEDLARTIEARHGVPPVFLAVSFGGGIVLEWMKRQRLAGRFPNVRGLLLISPVVCTQDLIDPGETKPSTLLGRAINAFVTPGVVVNEAHIERSRTIFTKMFEAGAQNSSALGALMTRTELENLQSSVFKTIRSITFTGACERIRALNEMTAPTHYFSQALLPLSEAPSLILYSEKESAVLASRSPTRFALEAAHRAYLPQSDFRIVRNPGGTPVQHASLIFHCFNFLPHLSKFYRGLRQIHRRNLAA